MNKPFHAPIDLAHDEMRCGDSIAAMAYAQIAQAEALQRLVTLVEETTAVLSGLRSLRHHTEY